MLNTTSPHIDAEPRVRDLMQSKVICIRDDMPITEVARLLTGHHISGAPVVDAEGKPLGVISLFDLVLGPGPQIEPPRMSHPPYHGEIYFGFQQLKQDVFHEGNDGRVPTAADLMSPTIIEVDPDATLAEAAARMLYRHVHRVIVIEDGRVSGVLSTMDVLRCIPLLLDEPRKCASAAPQ